MSLARWHFERTVAAREAAAAPKAAEGGAAETTSANMPLHDRMLITLRGHKMALKGIQSRAKKAEFKAEILPEYDAYIDGVLATGNGAQDTVLVTVMLWRIDAGFYSAAGDIIAYALRHGLAMPEGFSRDLPTTVVEELAERALAEPEHPQLRDTLELVLDLVADVDMPDEVRAEALKALGTMLQDTDPARTAELWSSALQLHPKVGVKTQLERLRKTLDAAAAEADTESAGGDAGT